MEDPLPLAPESLLGDRIVLQFSRVVPGHPPKGIVPSYHFRVLTYDGNSVGHINFRVGETRHVTLVAGHIGYKVKKKHRGNGYAEEACRVLAPFVASLREEVIITANPDNHASLRIIEKLGAEFLAEIVVPEDDPSYPNGARRKCRFSWKPGFLATADSRGKSA